MPVPALFFFANFLAQLGKKQMAPSSRQICFCHSVIRKPLLVELFN